ncbi:MAG TPA: hypothetical protein VGO92_14605 [Acidimicrobiales bacterium]|jgi:hypothetical protein|nr:hypothetical protein [Acidimicrobiales bacterium]
MSTTAEYASDGTTLVEVIRRFEAEGYSGQFSAVEGAALRCLTCRAVVGACDVELGLLRRTEGASDPDDMVAVAGLVCPACGAQGTVALKYGPESTPDEADVLAALEGTAGPATPPA